MEFSLFRVSALRASVWLPGLMLVLLLLLPSSGWVMSSMLLAGLNSFENSLRVRFTLSSSLLLLDMPLNLATPSVVFVNNMTLRFGIGFLVIRSHQCLFLYTAVAFILAVVQASMELSLNLLDGFVLRTSVIDILSHGCLFPDFRLF